MFPRNCCGRNEMGYHASRGRLARLLRDGQATVFTPYRRPAAHVLSEFLVVISLGPQSEHTSYRLTVPSGDNAQYGRLMWDDVVGALERGERHVIVDCAAWNRLDLRVLSALIRCARACGELGAVFELLNVQDHVRADLRQLRLDSRVGVVS